MQRQCGRTKEFMDQEHNFSPDIAQQRGWGARRLLIVVLLAVLAAAGGTYFLTRDAGGESPSLLSSVFDVRSEDTAAPATQASSSAALTANATEGTAQEAIQAAERVEQVVVQQGGLDSRVAAMEQRLTRLDLQSQAAAGNAARAEGLLIAFASRRAIERGAPLGYLADQLRLRFGEARPNAVQTVIDASQDPVTLDQLLARLDGLSATLTQAPADEGVFDWLARGLSELFVIRREDTPSPMAERRLERARLFLESGRTEAAVAEVRNLPNAVEALDWVSDAERFAAAQRALELLETAAVLEPRDLRDGAGAQVDQLSPTQGD